MKTTGMVRNIDELGRIVIPKEIRRTMDIPSGAPMEICMSGECIILKKHTSKEEINENLAKGIEVLKKQYPDASFIFVEQKFSLFIGAFVGASLSSKEEVVVKSAFFNQSTQCEYTQTENYIAFPVSFNKETEELSMCLLASWKDEIYSPDCIQSSVNTLLQYLKLYISGNITE